MKILLATDLYVPAVNGVVTSTISLKQSLENLGHEVRVLTLAEEGYVDPMRNIYAVSSLNINKVYPGARVKLFRDRSVLKDIIFWEPELIHTQSEFSTFRMAKYIAQYLNIPIVHTYHTIYEDYTHYFSPSEKTGKKIVSMLTKKLLEDAEAVIAPTKKVQRLLIDYEVSQPISVIPTGIQLEKFKDSFSEEDLLKIRDHYHIPRDAFLLLSLGRLGKEKNIEELLFFLSLLKLDVYFLIVGDGPNKYHLTEYTKELRLEDRVVFTGMINPDEISIYYQAADLFVSASSSETQGLTYIEALASGLPALCRSDEAIENVVVDGQTGFQYHSFKEFEACLYFLMNNHEAYQQMATAARDIAFEYFSSAGFGKQVEAIYCKAVETYYTKQMIQNY